jgi:hypothetical protein
MGQNNNTPIHGIPIDGIAGNGGKKNGNKSYDSSSHSKIFIGIDIGAGIPGLNYGKADSIGNNDASHITGYAKTGFQFNIKGGYYFTPNFGAMLQVGGNMNGFNTEAFQQTGYLFQYSNVTVSATSNYIGSYLAGFIFNMPPDEASTWNKLSVNFHILAGLMTARYSTITATYTDSLKASHSSVTSFQSAIAFEVDMGFRRSNSY